MALIELKISRQNCDVVTFMMVTAATAASENGSLCPRERALVERWLKLTLRASIKLLNSWINCCGQKWNRNEKNKTKDGWVNRAISLKSKWIRWFCWRIFPWNRLKTGKKVESAILNFVLWRQWRHKLIKKKNNSKIWMMISRIFGFWIFSDTKSHREDFWVKRFVRQEKMEPPIRQSVD